MNIAKSVILSGVIVTVGNLFSVGGSILLPSSLRNKKELAHSKLL
jgi:hypothetical protein